MNLDTSGDYVATLELEDVQPNEKFCINITGSKFQNEPGVNHDAVTLKIEAADYSTGDSMFDMIDHNCEVYIDGDYFIKPCELNGDVLEIKEFFKGQV